MQKRITLKSLYKAVVNCSDYIEEPAERKVQIK